MKIPHLLQIGAAAMLMTACSHAPLAPGAFVAYAMDKDNGLVQTRDFDDLALRLRYRPVEELVLQELGTEAPSDSIQHAMKALKVKDLLNARSPDPDDYFRKQYYFGSLVDADLLLVIGADTLPCALAHFERTYGAAPFNELVVSFIDDSPEPYRDDLHFIYNDRAFGLGPVEFVIRKEDLQQLPSLKLS
jgi:hypothetical protein